jgi:hypothetical protein
MPRIGCAILLLICCGVAENIEAQSLADLKTVLERAQSYVAAYEEQLGSVIGEEDYKQTAVWDQRGRGTRIQRRNMSSDFLLTRIGKEWFGVRNVLVVNRERIVDKPADFSKILSKPPESAVRDLMDINNSNWSYNIGDFTRTFNVPTYPLKIFYGSNPSRFTFEKGPEQKIGDVVTWEVGFSEVVHPTMIRDLRNNDQVQHGRLWIEPNTGRILKTETLIDARTGDVRAKVTFIVTYKQSSKLNMLVLDTMKERYDSGFHRVDCLATYSNFRRFETDVKLDIGPVQ